MQSDIIGKRNQSPQNTPSGILVPINDLCDIFELCDPKRPPESLGSPESRKKQIAEGHILIHTQRKKFKEDKEKGTYCGSAVHRQVPLSRSNIRYRPDIYMSFSSAATRNKHGFQTYKKESLNGLHFEIEGTYIRETDEVQVFLAKINGIDLSHDWGKFVDEATEGKKAFLKEPPFNKALSYAKAALNRIQPITSYKPK